MTRPERAPAAALRAAGSGRAVRLDELGRTAVVLLFGQSTLAAVDPVVAAVRATYPEEQVVIVSVVHLANFPGLLRKVAEMTMNGRYEAEAKKLRAGLSPEEYIMILPDWDGSVTSAFAVNDVEKELAVAVVDAAGRIVSVYQGAAPEAVVTGMLEPVVSA